MEREALAHKKLFDYSFMQFGPFFRYNFIKARQRMDPSKNQTITMPIVLTLISLSY